MINYQNYTMQNAQNTCICVIENESIVQMGSWGNPPKEIGVTLKKYNDLYDLLTQYREKLIELGVIEREKTQEEMQKENQLILSEILKRLDNLEQEKTNVRHQKDNTDGLELFSREKGKDSKRT